MDAFKFNLGKKRMRKRPVPWTRVQSSRLQIEFLYLRSAGVTASIRLSEQSDGRAVPDKHMEGKDKFQEVFTSSPVK